MAGTSYPEEIAVIQSFVEGEYGLGPWWFFSDWALKTNVISPRGAVLDVGALPVTITAEGGPLALPGGQVAGRSLLVSPTSTEVALPRVDGALEYIPVIPGTTVTGSVYVVGLGARLQLRFYGPTGTPILTTTGVATATTDTVRLADTALVPAGAVSMLLIVQYASRVARPAITWTASVKPWSSGQGAPRVHLSEISTDVVLATDDRQYASASFQIVEVG